MHNRGKKTRPRTEKAGSNNESKANGKKTRNKTKDK